ncbi:YhgE/Pip domain-containing protein [Sporosarcina sp. NPDC096371]|uniref:YhgE/Pip domain-containing protein n=1 Tax=Sporosarcina sp. NPDC096371 TaxID=3364530 RepID=UPI00381F913A
MKFKNFLKTKGARGAIFMGIFYQIAMLVSFMPGYTAIPNNINQLPIAIINDDAGKVGASIAEQLEGNLPFEEIATDLTNKQALKQLDENVLKLVIHIPETFSEDVMNGEASSSIDFTINEAGPTVVTSTMDSVVSEISTTLNKQFSEEYATGVLMNLNVPEEQAAAMATAMQNQVTENVVKINEIPLGMHNAMAPMFLTMAGYVGAMIGAMQLVGAFRASRGKASKTKLFIYMQLTALLIGVVATVVGLGIAYFVDGHGVKTFFTLWGHHALNYYVSFQFTSIFMLLVGEAGMILNIPFLLMQTIANGAAMTREMMYAPYQWLSHISPMYYSVQADFAIMYGGGDALGSHLSLLLVGLVALIINIGIVSVFHKKVPVTTESIA